MTEDPSKPEIASSNASEEKATRTGRCFLNRLLNPGVSILDSFFQSIAAAKETAKRNSGLTRSERNWFLLATFLALGVSALLGHIKGGGWGRYVLLGATLLYCVILQFFIHMHLATVRFPDGRMSTIFGLPNGLTCLRLMLVPPMSYYLADPLAFGEWSQLILWILLVVGLTDSLDGLLARMMRQSTDFGMYLDPLTDVVVSSASAISLGIAAIVPWWLIGMVVFRYFGALVGFLVVFTRTGNFDFKPTRIGKTCTPAVQILFFLLIMDRLPTAFALGRWVRLGLIALVSSIVAVNVLLLAHTMLRLLSRKKKAS